VSLATATHEWLILPSQGIKMNDFNRKVEEASVRLGKTVGEVANTLEKESAELINYLNDEVVPAVRQHSTKALRVAAEKLTRLANYMDSQRK
jgi:hypothetical protein